MPAMHPAACALPSLAVVGVVLLTATLAADPCPSYADTMRPLLESGDVAKLREAFLTINDPAHSVVTKFVYPIERTVAVEARSVRMLVSLSTPLLAAIDVADLWPANNNIGDPAAEEDAAASLTELTPSGTVHGGVRYVHGCQRLQQRSCFRRACVFRPDQPVMTGEGGKQIFVPLDNFIAANGSDMTRHVKEGEGVYDIVGFKKMAVEECFARQLFRKPAEDNCFNSSKFFSLPERTESYHWGAGRIGVAEKTAFFVVMS